MSFGRDREISIPSFSPNIDCTMDFVSVVYILKIASGTLPEARNQLGLRWFVVSYEVKRSSVNNAAEKMSMTGGIKSPLSPPSASSGQALWERGEFNDALFVSMKM